MTSTMQRRRSAGALGKRRTVTDLNKVLEGEVALETLI